MINHINYVKSEAFKEKKSSKVIGQNKETNRLVWKNTHKKYYVCVQLSTNILQGFLWKIP